MASLEFALSNKSINRNINQIIDPDYLMLWERLGYRLFNVMGNVFVPTDTKKTLEFHASEEWLRCNL